MCYKSTMKTHAHPNRPIRSFVRREGRMTVAQRTAWETEWPRYGLSVDTAGSLDFPTLFGRASDVVLEIGFGDGNSLLQMAKEAPHQDFIGVEVYRTGVGSLLLALKKDPIANIRIFCADAVEVLENCIPQNSLSKVQIFFADPWPKTRHHKRRLIQTHFIDCLAKKIRIGGVCHFATDWSNYADHMMGVMSSNAAFRNLAGFEQFMPRPAYRPLTKYEKRGHRLGHETWDLVFERIDVY